MAKFLMTQRDVPDDEADDVRALLDGLGIEFYETKPSLWGVSGGGFWIVDAQRLPEARAALADYQARRALQARAQRDADRAAGRLESSWTTLRRQPLQVLAALVGILLMVALTLLPFMLLRG